MPPTVSIVLPCYNVGRYLDECLDSLTRQVYRHLQIIAVNDGSTDETPTILRARAKSDSRLLLIDQDNKGLGAARNTGFGHATGDYIIFVDSDDYLSLDALEILVLEAEKTQSDIVMGARVKFNSKRQYISPKRTFTRYRPKVTAAQFPAVFGVIAVHGKLFRASFLHKHHLTFQEVRAQEDSGFSYIAYRRARNITVLVNPVYYYRKRDSGDPSITQSRLKRASLLGRFAQIETTIALAFDANGQRTTPHRRPFRTEFEKRLMRHIVRFADAVNDGNTAAALEMVATFSDLYRPQIEKHCSGVTTAIYREIWKRDLDGVKRALAERAAALAKPRAIH